MGWAEEVAETAVRTYGALQKEEELACLLALARSMLRAEDAILEIGCDVGGTLWAWEQLPGNHVVVGVTLPERPISKDRPPLYHQARMVFADSSLDATWLRVQKLLGEFELGLLFLDGDHTLAGVKRDFELYRPLVRAGGLVALHDIRGHMPGWCEVDQFWAQLPGLKLDIVYPPVATRGIGVLCV